MIVCFVRSTTCKAVSLIVCAHRVRSGLISANLKALALWCSTETGEVCICVKQRKGNYRSLSACCCCVCTWLLLCSALRCSAFVVVVACVCLLVGWLVGCSFPCVSAFVFLSFESYFFAACLCCSLCCLRLLFDFDRFMFSDVVI